MSPIEFSKLLKAASVSTKLVNAGNHDVIEIASGKMSTPAKLAQAYVQDQTPRQAPPIDQSAIDRIRRAAAIGIQPSTDEAKLNKTETAYLSWLRQVIKPHWISIQGITLKIGDDCRLTPDFAVIDQDGFRFVDTKGTRRGKVFYEDDAIVKMRVAARLNTWAKFFIAWKGTDRAWQHRELKT